MFPSQLSSLPMGASWKHFSNNFLALESCSQDLLTQTKTARIHQWPCLFSLTPHPDCHHISPSKHMENQADHCHCFPLGLSQSSLGPTLTVRFPHTQQPNNTSVRLIPTSAQNPPRASHTFRIKCHDLNLICKTL